MKGLLHIRLLGEITVLRETEQLVLPPSKKTRALLAYLAMVGRPQRRDHLCRMFWETPDDPRASLRWSLSKLRQVINPAGGETDRLQTDRSTVFLDSVEITL